MPFRALELPAPGPGQVWLASMPGRFEPWQAFLDEARQRRLQQVLCLNPRHEIERLSPAYAAALAEGNLPFRWTHLPMQDFGLATEIAAYRAVIDDVADTVRGGGSVLLLSLIHI